MLLDPSAVHSDPPFIGGGLLHVRDRLRWPPPQVTEQELHSCHSDQPPLMGGFTIDSSKEWIKILCVNR